MTHCVSINDTFWVKREDEVIKWSDVSPYCNALDAGMSEMIFTESIPDRCVTTGIIPELFVDGSFVKCCGKDSDGLCIIKRGTDGYANSGLEPYGEVFTSQIYESIVGSAVQYELIKHHGIIASKCKLFTNDSVGFVPCSKLLEDHTQGGIVEYYSSTEYRDMFNAMLVADAVCFNVDKHAGNHGVLFNNDTLDFVGMAPVFDHNLSLLPYVMESDFPKIWDYIGEQGPRIGRDWVEIARRVLNPNTRRRLINLKGYTIPFEGDEKFTKKRVDLMNDVINEQINRILA